MEKHFINFVVGNIILCEGDRVAFGHPVGRYIPFGTMERQVNNHHQFIVSYHRRWSTTITSLS
jgi:hypothetical protein